MDIHLGKVEESLLLVHEPEIACTGQYVTIAEGMSVNCCNHRYREMEALFKQIITGEF